jgi:hypothetical protein
MKLLYYSIVGFGIRQTYSLVKLLNVEVFEVLIKPNLY